MPNSIGVNIHFTGNPVDIKLIKEAGIKTVRMDMNWSTIELQKGIFDFKDTGYDELNNSLIKNNIRPLYILDYSNPFYEKSNSITTTQGMEGFTLGHSDGPKFVED